jgi:hypothetical protein
MLYNYIHHAAALYGTHYTQGVRSHWFNIFFKKICKCKMVKQRNSFPLCTMMVHGRMKVPRQAFLTSALDGSGWLIHDPAASPPPPPPELPWENPSYVFNGRLEEPRIQSGRCEKEEISCPCPFKEMCHFHLQPSLYTDYAVLAPL